MARQRRNPVKRGKTALPNESTQQSSEEAFSYGFSRGTQRKRTSEKVSNFTSSTVSVDAVSKVLIGASEQRNYLLIQNVGSNAAFLGFASKGNLNGSNNITLLAGNVLSFENGIVPSTTIEAISTGGTTLAILEGVEVEKY